MIAYHTKQRNMSMYKYHYLQISKGLQIQISRFFKKLNPVTYTHAHDCCIFHGYKNANRILLLKKDEVYHPCCGSPHANPMPPPITTYYGT
jgi:hypothetical protein